VRHVREAGAGVITHRARPWGHRLAFAVAMFSTVVSGETSVSAQTRRPSGRPAAPASARHAPFKAIFEPVNYPRDVDISDVLFIDADTGWICGHHRTLAGDGGFISATRDGGRTWSVQFGDPDSPNRAFTQLFFFDAAHGWATQADGMLLRTIDGTSWTRAGHVDLLSPIAFITQEKGFSLDRGRGIQTTVDGGRKWTPGISCEPSAIAFAPDHATGYVLTRTQDSNAAALLKTTDAGERWTPVSIIRETNGTDVSLAFSDPLTGYLRAGATLRMTSDGGQSWRAVTAKVPNEVARIVVRGPVGWMIGSHEFSYTLDGGRWITRHVDFPSRVLAFSVLDSNNGYVVGSHGMIYRYRVAPFEYAVPHMLAIPGMTTFVRF
jgi:photosystem II stability/assembly factor-like uncharacterized protein